MCANLQSLIVINKSLDLSMQGIKNGVNNQDIDLAEDEEPIVDAVSLEKLFRENSRNSSTIGNQTGKI